MAFELARSSDKYGELNAFESGHPGTGIDPTADSTLITADQTLSTADATHFGGDTASFTGAISVGGVLAAVEGADTAGFFGLGTSIAGVLAAQEASDVANFAGGAGAVIFGYLEAYEDSALGRDTAGSAESAAFNELGQWERVEGGGARNEVQRTIWLQGQGRVTWLENEVEETFWLQNLEPGVVSLANERLRITGLEGVATLYTWPGLLSPPSRPRASSMASTSCTISPRARASRRPSGSWWCARGWTRSRIPTWLATRRW